jgi:hypothetical protein
MDYTNGEDRVLFVKLNGIWMPVGCLIGNTLSESSEMMPTTTRDNDGWATSRPTMQTYSIGFDGLQINTTADFGNFFVASYDRLKLLKRNKQLLDWKIQGTTFPIVDYGKCYVNELSEASTVGEFLSFTGSMTGFGIPKVTTLGETVLNDGNPDSVITTSIDANLIIKTKEV